MVEFEGILERRVMGERTKAGISIVSCGIILANLVIVSSRMFANYAPLQTSSAWLNVASFACGLALGLALDKASSIFFGSCLMALIAVVVFSGVMVGVLGTALLDVVLLFAFQQSFPRFVWISALGLSGTVFSMFVRLWRGQL